MMEPVRSKTKTSGKNLTDELVSLSCYMIECHLIFSMNRNKQKNKRYKVEMDFY